MQSSLHLDTCGPYPVWWTGRKFRGPDEGWAVPDSVLITVVCRENLVVDTDVEHHYLRAWRYANHLTAAFDGDTYVVTPHGWCGVIDPRSGLEPRLTSSFPLRFVTTA